MSATVYSQDAQTGQWWRLADLDEPQLESLPLHRRLMLRPSATERVVIAEGALPEGAERVEPDQLPTEARTTHPLRVPWALSGWLEAALGWITEQVGPIQSWRELRSWSLSCVLRLETAQGVLYFKATNQSPALFAHEGRATQGLACRLPERVPAPVAIAPEQGWMLLTDFGPSLRETQGDGAIGRALTDFSLLQQQTLGEEAELLALGCVDRRPAHFAAELPALLNDALCLETLTDPQRTQLQQTDWLARLAPYQEAPCSLVHGDLHAGNVAEGASGLLYFDWTDASVGLPWLDLLTPLWEREPEAAARLYAHWGVPVPPWPELAPLIALHHAISYRHIYHAVEPCVRHEHGHGVALFLQKVATFA